MLDKVQEGKITLERVVEKMAHAPAILFNIKNRGFIREGYAADLVLVNPMAGQPVQKEELLYMRILLKKIKTRFMPIQYRTKKESLSLQVMKH